MIEMDGSSVPKPEWTLTEESFAKFLDRLAPDRELAGEEYEKLRLMLVKLFDWRGAHFPEECADETLNRVARKIDSGEVIRDMVSYCHAIARLVFLETLKHPEHKKVSLDELTPIASPDSETRRRRYLARMLQRLLARTAGRKPTVDPGVLQGRKAQQN